MNSQSICPKCGEDTDTYSMERGYHSCDKYRNHLNIIEKVKPLTNSQLETLIYRLARELLNMSKDHPQREEASLWLRVANDEQRP